MSNNHIQQSSATIKEARGQSGARGEGPYMVISMKVQDERIAQANFETYGCPYAIACGNWLTGWLTGKTLTQAEVIEAADLSLMLGGLPLGKEHCAIIAIQALKASLKDLAISPKAVA